MTRQETFKRRVRARLAKTGEKYGAARRALIDSGGRAADWVSPPHMDDHRVREATGRGWEEWRTILDAFPGRGDGHSAIVAHLVEAFGVDGWWAQTVTVGYERISGLRLPYQMADGTFTANKTRTVDVDPDILREILLDSASRADLFPGLDTELRSRVSSKGIRLAMGPGVALISSEPVGDGRARISVSHEGLPQAGDVVEWKAFWEEWLEAIDRAD